MILETAEYLSIPRVVADLGARKTACSLRCHNPEADSRLFNPSTIRAPTIKNLIAEQSKPLRTIPHNLRRGGKIGLGTTNGISKMDAGNTDEESGSVTDRPLPPIPDSEQLSIADGRREDTELETSSDRLTRLELDGDNFGGDSSGKASNGTNRADGQILSQDIPGASNSIAIRDATRAEDCSPTPRSSSDANDGVPSISSAPGTGMITDTISSSIESGLPASDDSAIQAGLGQATRPHRTQSSSGTDPAEPVRQPAPSRSQSQRGSRRDSGLTDMERNQYIIPNWEPDASAVLCPICRTQFSMDTQPASISEVPETDNSKQVFLLENIIAGKSSFHHCS